MTSYEMKRIAEMQAEYLVQALKEDEELLDLMYPPRRLNMKEAAEYLRIPEGTLRHMTNEIPHQKVGRMVIFTDRGLTRWLERKSNRVSKEIKLKTAI